MIRTTLRTALFGLVIALTIAACDSGPGSSPATSPTKPPPVEPEPPPRPLNWADVLNEHQVKEATYAIGVYAPGAGLYAIGTGFAAHYVDAIWTNAHVLLALLDLMEEYAHVGLQAIAVQSGTETYGDGTYLLVYYYLHPKYDGSTLSPDLALITINGEVPAVLDLLPREHARSLQAGQPIATTGFPGELQEAYRNAPIATFKEGTISAMRPYTDVAPTPENTTLLQHNLNLSGGTSGSPIIDQQGYVIAANHAGIQSLVYDENTGMIERIGRGNIEFGIRADEMWGAIDYWFDSSSRQVAASTRPVLDSYQAFPENWDGTTVAPSSHTE